MIFLFFPHTFFPLFQDLRAWYMSGVECVFLSRSLKHARKAGTSGSREGINRSENWNDGCSHVLATPVHHTKGKENLSSAFPFSFPVLIKERHLKGKKGKIIITHATQTT